MISKILLFALHAFGIAYPDAPTQLSLASTVDVTAPNMVRAIHPPRSPLNSVNLMQAVPSAQDATIASLIVSLRRMFIAITDCNYCVCSMDSR